MSGPNKDLEPYICSIIYYLYRQAGCPFGDTLAGLDLWKQSQLVGPFQKLIDKSLNLPPNEDQASDQ